MLHPKIYSKLVCPVSHQILRYQHGVDSFNGVLICEKLDIFYPIENGIPLLLQEKALPLNTLSEYWLSHQN